MKRANAWKVLVVALVVLVVAAALVVPVVAGAVAVGRPTAGDGSTAAVCQSGHACGGAPVAPCVRAGLRVAGLRSRSSVRVGTPAVGSSWPGS